MDSVRSNKSPIIRHHQMVNLTSGLRKKSRSSSNNSLNSDETEQNLQLLLKDDICKSMNNGKGKVKLLLSGWNKEERLENGLSRDSLRVEDISTCISDQSETFSDLGNP